MRRWSKISVCVAVVGVLLMGAVSYRVWRILPYPVGTGESKKSPNGRFEALVTDYYDENFWGYLRRWFEFEIRGGAMKQHLVTDPIPGPYFGSRSAQSVVYWAEDSSSVRFVFPLVEIRIKPE